MVEVFYQAWRSLPFGNGQLQKLQRRVELSPGAEDIGPEDVERSGPPTGALSRSNDQAEK